MTVQELIDMLSHPDINRDVEVTMIIYHGNEMFQDKTIITGMLYNKEEVILTDESLD